MTARDGVDPIRQPLAAVNRPRKPTNRVPAVKNAALSSVITETPIRRIEVGYLCEFPTLLGGERSLLTFLSALPKDTVRPIVVAPPEGALSNALDSLGIARLSWPAGGKKKPEALCNQLRHVDVIHANSLMTAEAAVILAKHLGVPAVAHVRDVMNLSANKWRTLGELDAIIAVSRAVADWLRQHLSALETQTRKPAVYQIYNAVDLEKMQRSAQPGSLRRELRLSPDHRIITCIGQWSLRKGQDLFLKACQKLAVEDPALHFLLVGARYSGKSESIEYEAAVRALASDPPLAGRTFILGERSDVPTILADTDVVVVPSRQEPLSRVLLEALALNVPAVATDVGGNREILADGRCGLLVPPDSPEPLAQACLKLLPDRSLANHLITYGQEHFRRLFTLENHTQRILHVYQSLTTEN